MTTGRKINIGKAKLMPKGTRTILEPKKGWARAKDQRKAGRLAAAWLKKGRGK